MVRHIKPSELAFAAALALSSFSAAAQLDAAQMRTMEAAARVHIAAFPGRTMHAADHSYVVSDAIADEDGTQHVRFQRSYRGLPVIGGDMVVHSDRNGNFREVSLTLNRLINLPSRGAGLSAGRAIQAALDAHAGSTRGMRPELVVYARGDVPMLAWDVRVFGERVDGTPSERHVIVDAHAGAVLEAWDDIHTAAAAGTGKTLYSGNMGLTTDKVGSTYYLRDPSRGSTKTNDGNNSDYELGTLMTDTDNIWGNNATSSRQSAGADAQYGSAVTWDYFKNVHGRNGIANNGVGHLNVVHTGNRVSNAYWSDSCFCASFGDGDGSYETAFVSLDVVGHEMAHGVTGSTAKLVYSGESGGLNEATSDIFGTMVEFYAANAKDPGDFLIGETISIRSPYFLRSMITPSSDGVSADCWYSSLKNLDVHHSSGVANHWFYLMVMGTTNGSPSKTCLSGNTRVATGNGTVQKISSLKAEKIWYRALTVYMTSSTNYSGARAATIKAAQDLYGASSSTARAVGDGWTAVGVR